MHSYLNEPADFSGATHKHAVKSAKKLENNMSGGVALNLVLILLYFCVCLIGAITAIFLSTVTMGFPFSDSFDFVDISSAVISLLLYTSIVAPLKLSIKGWYKRLSVSQTPLVLAFSSFTSLKGYVSAFGFCAFKLATAIAIGLVSFVPSAFLFGVSNGIFKSANAIDEYSVWFLVFGVILLCTGIIFILYTMLSFFYIDYIFLSGKIKNPFKIYSASFSLFIKHKGLLFKTIINATPYIISLLLVFTIPFSIVKIKAIFAAHAGVMLSAFGESGELK